MTADMEFEERAARPLWLITLADLALLLVGFFVLMQASQGLDRSALANGLRAGFGVPAAPAAVAPKPMPVALASVEGFAAGSAIPGDASAAIAWARDAARDPRVILTITGETDGSARDIDAASGSGAILAADRARSVAAILARSGAVAPARISIATGHGKARRVVLTLGFDGGTPAASGKDEK